MSATHSLQTSSASTEPKKKFGTNLNKLSKPPPPPSSSLNFSSVRGGSSHNPSRNGLHFLTTKRSNSLHVASGVGNSLSTSKSKINTPASVAPKPVNTPSLRSENFIAYDSLQKGTVATNGAATGRGTSNDVSGVRSSQQTAWGLLDKTLPPVASTSQVSSVSTPVLPVLAPKGVVSSGYFDRRRVISDEASKVKHSGLQSVPSTKLGENEKSVDTDRALAVSQSDENKVILMDLDSSSRASFTQNLIQDTNFAKNNVSEVENLRDKRIDKEPDEESQLSALSITSNVEQSDFNELNSLSVVSTTSQASVFESQQSSTNLNEPSVPNLFQNISQSETVENSKEKIPSENEYLQQNIDSSKLSNGLCNKEEMSRLAKERDEIRRVEEMALENERKERMARRLRNPEDSSIPQNIVITSNEPASMSSQKRWRNANKGNRATASNVIEKKSKNEVVLELLGRSKQNGGQVKGNSESCLSSEKSTDSNNNAKTVIQSKKTFSSLVGGSTQAINSREMDVADEHKSETLHQSSENQASPGVSYANVSNHGMHEGVDEQPLVPFVQPSSYNDRDRGERSGPRMLFDPKSGSMVAAPSDKRGHHHTNDVLKLRKDRNKLKPRAGRDRDKELVNQVFMAKRQDQIVLTEDEFVRRGKKSFEGATFDDRRLRRSEETNILRKERKTFDRNDGTTPFNNAVSLQSEDSDAFMNSANTPNKRYSSRTSIHNQLNLDKSKIPRTCGVLYKLDQQGVYVCVDGCEADQGYGAHSVPGGRMKNPQAHAKYLEHQLKQRQNLTEKNYVANKVTYNGPKFAAETQQISDAYNHVNGSFHHTTYMPSGNDNPKRADLHVKRIAYAQMDSNLNFQKNANESLDQRNFMNDLPEHSSQAHQNAKQFDYSLPSSSLRAKPSEIISIITGDPESPELQATANPWAPNQVALAAAAAATVKATTHTTELHQQPHDFDIVSTNIMNVIHDNDIQVDDELETNQNFEGLGFDPTENMDTVIMSPSIVSEKADCDGVDLKSLTLNAIESENVNPFAPLTSPSHFLDPSTWVAGGSLPRPSGGMASLGAVSVGSINWNLLGTERKDCPSRRNSHNANSNPIAGTAASFLSLSPLSVTRDGVNWGTGALGTGLNESLQYAHSKGSGEASE